MKTPKMPKPPTNRWSGNELARLSDYGPKIPMTQQLVWQMLRAYGFDQKISPHLTSTIGVSRADFVNAEFRASKGTFKGVRVMAGPDSIYVTVIEKLPEMRKVTYDTLVDHLNGFEAVFIRNFQELWEDWQRDDRTEGSVELDDADFVVGGSDAKCQ
jgi:hypothetical protein